MKSNHVHLRTLAAAMLAIAGMLTAPALATANEVATAATPGSATAPPGSTIEAFHAGLLEIMKQAKELGIQGRIDKLTPLINRTFDLEFMARKTIGRHWRTLSDEEKKRWTSLFKKFTCANYAGRFTGFTGEEFVTIGIEDAPRGTYVVLTKILVPSDEDVELNYRLIEHNGQWKVIDVFLNGTVSELALRRSEYSSALKREGFTRLLDSVEAKIKDLKSNDLIEG